MVISYSLELEVDTERTQRIKELAYETDALLKGDFTLSSGKKSDHYYDGKQLSQHPEGAYLIGEEIFDMLEGIDFDAIGGLAISAIPIVTAVTVVSHIKGQPIRSFWVREEPKKHGTEKRIEGQFKKNSKVVIIDDVITGGNSIKKAIDAVRAEGCEVVKVIVVVDRNEGGSDQLREEGYDFKAIIDLSPSGEASISEPSAVTGEAG
ncbi:MAG: orotate phosphoribosyltransferase [Dehalococcoidales bacterium]|nr:orotate phosphoribosyltransferase [Dehalococcoidales bacterium]